MKRRLSLIMAIVFVLVAVAAPCLAAEIDYQDYKYNTTVSGDNSIVSVSIPASAFDGGQIRLWENDLATLLTESNNGVYLTFEAVGDKLYGLSYVPTRNNKISVVDIPDGTSMSISSHFISSGSHSTNASARLTLDFYDINGSHLGNQVVAFASRPLTDSVFDFVLSKPVGAVSMGLTLVWRDAQWLNSHTVTLTIDSIDMEMTIDSLLLMQQETGRTNKLLDDILKNFDDYLNREPEPEVPDFQEPMQGAINAEQNILDELPMAGVLEEFRNKESLVTDGFQANAAAFSLVVQIWEKFFVWNSWYEFLCYFSLVIGCVVSFVGITLAFVSKKGGKDE